MENRKKQNKTLSQKVGEFLIRHPVSNKTLSVAVFSAVVLATCAVALKNTEENRPDSSYLSNEYEAEVNGQENQNGNDKFPPEEFQASQPQIVPTDEELSKYHLESCREDFKEALFYFWGLQKDTVNPRVRLFQETYNKLHPETPIKVDGLCGVQTTDAIYKITTNDTVEMTKQNGPFFVEALAYEDIKQQLLMKTDQYTVANDIVASLLHLPTPRETQNAVLYIQEQINQDLPEGKKMPLDGQLTSKFISSIYDASIDTLDDINEIFANRMPKVIEHHNYKELGPSSEPYQRQ